MSSGGSSALAVTLARVVTKRLPRPARVAARRKQTVFGLGARTGSPEPTTIYCDAPASVEPASGAEKGLALIEQGIKKGGLKRPEDAKLRLGEAQLYAGQKAKGVQTLKTVQGSDGTADIARLWILNARA